MKSLIKLIPWFFVALFGAEIVAVMMPKQEGEYHVREFGRLPVLLNGRIQPFDSVARNSLLQIRSTGDVPLEVVPSWQFWHHPKKLKSTERLLEVMFTPELADTRTVFLIGPVFDRVLNPSSPDAPVLLFTVPLFHHAVYLNDF